MELRQRLKRFLGIQKYSNYINDFFDRSNIKSSIIVSSVVIVLEVWMILSTLITQVSRRTGEWIFTHLLCYFLLLTAASVLLIYSILHRKKPLKKRGLWQFVRVLFSIVSIAFGIYISYTDYLKGEQFITLMTMTIFVFSFVVWRPFFSISFLATSYLVFFLICHNTIPASYATKINLTIILISVLMSAINSYLQKLSEAEKEEKLDHAHDILIKLSISDEVTGIANMNYFRSQALEYMNKPDVDVKKLIYLFLDIENFKILNQKYGYWEGNNFLHKMADIIAEIFQEALIAHFSNDNFVILTEDKQIKEKIRVICQKIKALDYDINLGLKVGAYRPEDKACLPLLACDHARYACNSIKKNYNITYCEYDSFMSDKFQKKQYILNNFDKAIENEYIEVYYQPLVNAASGKVCGLEALARWNDPEIGFLSPADFIETLEEYHQIHRLDMYIVDKVGKTIMIEKEKHKKILPVSLNFSRLDFDSLNLAEEVENCLQHYNIEKENIHIEVTESTLSENDDRLKDALKRFRDYGYALWLDDFGSGYSALNVLKEYEFDVMKIDMKFLSDFGNNEKAKQVLKNVITMAKDLGMKTLTEGVETQEAYDFLRENGCEMLQGFLFSKPVPRNEVEALIDSRKLMLE